MNLLIISGFLGSGKTTLLRHLAQEFANRYPELKMAIIENEVGKVGIDGQFLKNDGLVVEEINSGCICCSLRLDLIQTLLQLEREYCPDLVVIEPSGVAGPKQLLQSLLGYGGEIENKRILSIIDASRILNIPDMTIPIVADGIEIADVVVLNKTDIVDDQQLKEINDKIDSIRPDSPVVNTSALDGSNLDKVLEIALSDSYSNSNPELTTADFADSSVVNNAVVHAAELEISFNEGIAFKQLREDLRNLIHRISGKLKDAGCSMIGHLKAVLKTDKQGMLLISTTSFDQQPHAKGIVKNDLVKANLTINAIVYDIDRDVLGDLINTELATVEYLA